MTDRELMQDALDAILAAIKAGDWKVDGACDPDMVIERLRARIAQPEPEPVAWIGAEETWLIPKLVISYKPKDGYKPVYTAPPQREWQGLTDMEIVGIAALNKGQAFSFARAIEAKLKAKNEIPSP